MNWACAHTASTMWQQLGFKRKLCRRWTRAFQIKLKASAAAAAQRTGPYPAWGMGFPPEGPAYCRCVRPTWPMCVSSVGCQRTQGSLLPVCPISLPSERRLCMRECHHTGHVTPSGSGPLLTCTLTHPMFPSFTFDQRRTVKSGFTPIETPFFFLLFFLFFRNVEGQRGVKWVEHLVIVSLLFVFWSGPYFGPNGVLLLLTIADYFALYSKWVYLCFCYLVLCRRRKWHGATGTAKSFEKSCCLATHRKFPRLAADRACFPMPQPCLCKSAQLTWHWVYFQGSPVIPCGISAGTVTGLRLSALWESAAGDHLRQKHPWGVTEWRRRGSPAKQPQWRISSQGPLHPNWSASTMVCDTERAMSSIRWDHLPWFAVARWTVEALPLNGGLLREFWGGPLFTRKRVLTFCILVGPSDPESSNSFCCTISTYMNEKLSDRHNMNQVTICTLTSPNLTFTLFKVSIIPTVQWSGFQ